MAIEVRRHCKECQTNFTAALPSVKENQTLICPFCGSDIAPPSNDAHLRPAVGDVRYPVSGAQQVTLF